LVAGQPGSDHGKTLPIKELASKTMPLSSLRMPMLPSKKMLLRKKKVRCIGWLSLIGYTFTATNPMSHLMFTFIGITNHVYFGLILLHWPVILALVPKNFVI
jgi:hypothetical protein